MSENEEPVRIGITYCGGCNPDYDRVALAGEMARRLAGRVRFVPAGPEASDMVLAIQGCATACADLSAFEGSRVITITSRAEGEVLIQWLASREAAVLAEIMLNIRNGPLVFYGAQKKP